MSLSPSDRSGDASPPGPSVSPLAGETCTGRTANAASLPTRDTSDEVDLFPTIPTAEAPTQLFDPQCPVLPCRFGTYVLEQRIATGGMGVVYKARQLFNPAEPSMSRVVAVKMILPEKLGSLQVVKRFVAEAHSAARLEYHPNIVQIYDVGEVSGQPYFSMQYISGGSLQKIVDEGYILPYHAIAKMVRKIANAVHFAHTEAGIIHRDIKPSNILLGRDIDSKGDSGADQADPGIVSFTRWAPKITDFGLARNADSALTIQGEVMGTPSYMPPEQARGDLDNIGPHSDVYSIGAVLYALLTGRPPFSAPDAQATITRLLNDELVPPRSTEKGKQTPPDLERICLTCLAKNPARRYESAYALAEDLDRFLEGIPVQAPPPQSFSVLLRKVRNRLPQVVGALVVLACLVFLIVSALRDKDGKEHERQEQAAYENAVAEIQTITADVPRDDFKLADHKRELDRIYDRLKRLPEDRTPAPDAAESCNLLARQLWDHGSKDEANTAAEAAASICDELDAAGSLNDHARIQRATARWWMGRVAQDQQRFPAAQSRYRQALDELKNSAESEERVRLEARVHHSRGEMFNAQAEREKAVKEYTESIDRCRRLTREGEYVDKKARDDWNELARGHGYAGDTYLDLGKLIEAEKAYDEAERIRKRLDDASSSSKSKQQLGRSYNNTARLKLREHGRVLEAIQALRRAESKFREIVHESKGNVEFREDLAEASLDLTEALFDAPANPDRERETEELAQQCLSRYEVLIEVDPDKLRIHLLRARARLDVAQTNTRLAGNSLNKARAALLEVADKQRPREDPDTLYLLAVCDSMQAARAQTPEETMTGLNDAAFHLRTAIERGFANAEQLERDSRLSFFREKKKAEHEELVKKCRDRRKGKAGS